jgi:hypothetical protein
MGDTCGPCFDRRADGGTPAGGFGPFAGWSPGLSRFAFTADGRHLIGQGRTGAFRKVRRADGAAVTSKRKSFNPIAATGRDAAGVVLAQPEGSVYRWPADRDEVEHVLPSRQMWGRVAVPPDGSRVVLVGYQRAYLADLTADRPRYATVETAETFTAFQFAPDGARLLAVTAAGDICAIDPKTMAHAVLRRDVFRDLGTGHAAPSELAVSRDGTGVLVRLDWLYPRGRTTVHHVPLPAGRMVGLHIPDWHRPTALAYSPDGRHAITGEAEGGWVGFWDVAGGEAVGFARAVLEDVAWRSGQIEFAPDGRTLAVSYSTGHHDHGSTVALWPWPDVLAAASESGID